MKRDVNLFVKDIVDSMGLICEFCKWRPDL